MTAPSPKLRLYEVVVIKSTSTTRELSLADKVGAVLGIALPDRPDRPVTYAVGAYDFDETCMFAEDELVSTGRVESREAFYDGESVRVSREGEVLDGEP